MEIQEKNAIKRRRKSQKKAIKKARREKFILQDNTHQDGNDNVTMSTSRIEVEEEKVELVTDEITSKGSYCTIS